MTVFLLSHAENVNLFSGTATESHHFVMTDKKETETKKAEFLKKTFGCFDIHGGQDRAARNGTR